MSGTRTAAAAVTATPRRRTTPQPGSRRRIGLGVSLPPADVRAKTEGTFPYAADLWAEGLLWAAVLRSPHPHARIVSIDTAAAAAMPGVRAVVTHEDVPGDAAHGRRVADRPVFASGPRPPPRRADRRRRRRPPRHRPAGRRRHHRRVRGAGAGHRPREGVRRRAAAPRRQSDPPHPAALRRPGRRRRGHRRGPVPDRPSGPGADRRRGGPRRAAPRRRRGDLHRLHRPARRPRPGRRLLRPGARAGQGRRHRRARRDGRPRGPRLPAAARPARAAAPAARSSSPRPARSPSSATPTATPPCCATATTRTPRAGWSRSRRRSCSTRAPTPTPPPSRWPPPSPSPAAPTSSRTPSSRAGRSAPTTRRPAMCAARAPCRSAPRTRARWTSWRPSSASTRPSCGCATCMATGDLLPTGQTVTCPAPGRRTAAAGTGRPAARRCPRTTPRTSGCCPAAPRARASRARCAAASATRWAWCTCSAPRAPTRSPPPRSRSTTAVATVICAAVETGQGFTTLARQIVQETLGIEEVHVAPVDTDQPPAGPAARGRHTWVSGGAVERAAKMVRTQLLQPLAAQVRHVDRTAARSPTARSPRTTGCSPPRSPRRWTARSCGRPRSAARIPPSRWTRSGQGDAFVGLAFCAIRAVVDVDIELGSVRVVEMAVAQDVGRVLNPRPAGRPYRGGRHPGHRRGAHREPPHLPRRGPPPRPDRLRPADRPGRARHPHREARRGAGRGGALRREGGQRGTGGRPPRRRWPRRYARPPAARSTDSRSAPRPRWRRSEGARRSGRPSRRTGSAPWMPASARLGEHHAEAERVAGAVVARRGRLGGQVGPPDEGGEERRHLVPPDQGGRGRGGNRTRVTRFAGEPLNHSGTRPGWCSADPECFSTPTVGLLGASLKGAGGHATRLSYRCPAAFMAVPPVAEAGCPSPPDQSAVSPLTLVG